MTCLPIEKIPQQEQTKQKRQKYSFPFIWMHGYYRPHWTNISLCFRLRGIVGTGCAIFGREIFFTQGRTHFLRSMNLLKLRNKTRGFLGNMKMIPCCSFGLQ